MAEGTWRSQGPTGPPGVIRQASDRRVEPPLVVQNAMLTKDKKPFTYTPGGIDLSEIRSPRMARRIERNANAPGVGDMPRISPPRGPIGPLPPSALAAMQPALPVQVFPTGAPPPPPPPPVHIPPPPPPMEPLPTKSFSSNDGIFERPDMTKIIPENPMALLRKTGGVNRRSYIEEPDHSDVRPLISNQQNYATAQVSLPGIQNKSSMQHQQPSGEPQVQSQIQTQPQYVQSKPQMATCPKYETYEEQPQEIKTSTAQLGSLYIPPLNNENQRTAATPPAKVISPPVAPQKTPASPAQSPGSPQSPMATLNRAPRPWQTLKTPSTEVPPWAQRSQSPPSEQQQPLTSQPAAPVNYQRAAQSPSIQQQSQSPQRVPQSPGLQQNLNQQQTIPQQQPNVQSNVIGRVIIPVQMDLPPSNQSQTVDAVYVTQPIVLQHPGPRLDTNQQKIHKQQQAQQQRQPQVQQQQQRQPQVQQQQKQPQVQQQQQQREPQVQQQQQKQEQYQQQQKGNASNAPNSATPGTATPGTARSFNRQPSWSHAGPAQSNSFKVIQKITNTDGDDDENQESTEHGPKNSQHFQQAPTDQVRKLKLNEDDQEFMTKIKQVPRNTQVGNQGSNVRTIPVQIEDEASGRPYIPPSEQTVPEPKKYTGSKIPSRSFKVLQAMTGETCAEGNQASESNENYPQPNDPASYYFGYNTNYIPPPPPPAPYWSNYWSPYFYSPCPTPTSDTVRTDNAEKPPKPFRNTPAQFQKQSKKSKDNSESDSEYEGKGNIRSTSLPLGGCSPQKPPRKPLRDSESDSESDRKLNPTSRSHTPLPFRGCSPQLSQRKLSKEDGSHSEHEKRINMNSRNTLLPFRGCSPQVPLKKTNKDNDIEHMEGARRSTSLPRSTPLPYWSCYSPFYPLPYGDCDWEVEDIKCNSEEQQKSSRNTPLPFWGCYSPFYPIPYVNESDAESDQSKQSSSTGTPSQTLENETENQNYSPYPYWDPYNYPPYYYGYPPMYPYPIYPSVPCDSEESMNYSSTDEMAFYNKMYGQNNHESEDINEEEPDDSTPTPEKCQNFVEIRNKFEEKCRNFEENQLNRALAKAERNQEEISKNMEEKCNNFQELCKNFEDNCYVEDNRNFVTQHCGEKFKKIDEKRVITEENLKKHDEQYSDLSTETETETETETDANSSDSDYSDTETEVDGDPNTLQNKYSNSSGALQAIRSVSDINIYSVDEPNCTDEEDNVSEATTTTEENENGSVYMEDETIPHQLSTIYEESERSDCSRIGRHTRESSVATTVSVETVTFGNEHESDEESDETCINGTVYMNENDDLTAKFVIKNNENESINIDTTFIIPTTEVHCQSKSPSNVDGTSTFMSSKMNSNCSSTNSNTEVLLNVKQDTDEEKESNTEKLNECICEEVLTKANQNEIYSSFENKQIEERKTTENNQLNTEENHDDKRAINREREKETSNKYDDDEPDWWSEINKDRDDDLPLYRPKNIFSSTNEVSYEETKGNSVENIPSEISESTEEGLCETPHSNEVDEEINNTFENMKCENTVVKSWKSDNEESKTNESGNKKLATIENKAGKLILQDTEENGSNEILSENKLESEYSSDNKTKGVVVEGNTDLQTGTYEKVLDKDTQNATAFQNEELVTEGLKIASETSVKEIQRYAIVHNEETTEFISDSHIDQNQATIIEDECGSKATSLSCKSDSLDTKIIYDDLKGDKITKEELVCNTARSSRIEKAISQDIAKVNNMVSVTNNYVSENEEEINQTFSIHKNNGGIIKENTTENIYVKSSTSATAINDAVSEIELETQSRKLQETKVTSNEIQSSEVLCNGILESTNCLIENLQCLNELSKQYCLNNNQYKTEKIKQNKRSSKVVEHCAKDNVIIRKEKEDIVEKENSKEVSHTSDSIKEVTHKKVTKTSKRYSKVSSSEREDYQQTNKCKQSIDNNGIEVGNKVQCVNNNEQCEMSQLKNNPKIDDEIKIKTEVKRANQEIISNDFETCDKCSTNFDIENLVCSQESQPDLQNNESIEEEIRMPSIKERIEALQRASQGKNKTKEDTTINIKESITEDNQTDSETLKMQSVKNNRSLEDISEDDIDSGVTSDISRHISDNESDFPELRKMTKYQRASTHSRLFKLLQEECENEDSEEEKVEEQTVMVNNENEDAEPKITMQSRRESLTLPLKNYSESDSFSSSGINSPGSPVVSERLVNELVQSLLRRKKGQIFRGMSMEKLHAAAFRILQEELDGSQLSPHEYNSFLSPLRTSTNDSTPAQTPQEFYGNYSEYNQYYDSWNEAHLSYENNYDTLPSRAFKLIHDHAIANKSGGISGYLARCPRVLSSRNINKDQLYLSDHRSSQSPKQNLEKNGATSAS